MPSQTGNQIVIPAVTTVGAAVTPAIAAALTTAGWAVPVVGLAFAGVGIALTAIFNRKSPQQKLAATQAAEDIERELQRNKELYFASGRTTADQAAALANFDMAWAWLSGPQGCGNPALGSPGERCISERQRGGAAPWCPTGTGCDWFILYRDPIATDQVQTSALMIPGLGPVALPNLSAPIVGGLSLGWLLGAGLGGLVVWWMVSES